MLALDRIRLRPAHATPRRPGPGEGEEWPVVRRCEPYGLCTFSGRPAALLRSRSASAAVEFALILPVALVFYIGAAEVSDGVMTSRKVSQVTRTLVDLTSQQGTSSQLLSVPTPTNAMNATMLANIMAAAQTMISPQPSAPLQMTISAIDVVNAIAGPCCVATVRWSYTQNGSLRPCGVQLQSGPFTAGTTTQIPSTLMPVGTYLPGPLAFIVADVSYMYQPVVAFGAMQFTPTMQRTEYMMPRASGQVVAGPLPASGAQSGKICY